MPRFIIEFARMRGRSEERLMFWRPGKDAQEAIDRAYGYALSQGFTADQLIACEEIEVEDE